VRRILALLGAWTALVSTSPAPHVNDALILGDTLPPKLSDFRLLLGPNGGAPNRRVLPYTLNTPLFSDYAEKWRYLYVPEGKEATFGATSLLEFPVGSVLVKSFGYPADFRRPAEKIRILETRLLIRRASGWVALPYVWDADGKDATLKRAGTRIDVSWTHTDGKPRQISYAVPNVNQCKGCHDSGGTLTPIGPKVPNLNDGRQLTALMMQDVVQKASLDAMRWPVWNDPKTGTIEARARAYLEVNCGHCHSRGGPANTSGLWLDWDQPRDVNYGIAKRPTAAGRGSGNLDFAVAPGDPARSILLYRMRSLDPGIAMPELGRATVHDEGVALLSDWIATLK
jgi:uncharacterized repeat protein (TIGR03806 family)